MQAGLEITIYLIFAMVAGGTAATVAPMRGRTAGFWMPASFLFPPMVGILFLLPSRRLVRAPRATRRDPDNLDHL
jgi:hypothetical protein